MREKVTGRWRRERLAKGSHAWLRQSKTVPAAPAGVAGASLVSGANRTQWSAVWLCREVEEIGSTVLAGKRIFHIGSARTAKIEIKAGIKAYIAQDGPIAQLDRVTDFYSVGCRFESCWDRQCFQSDVRFVLTKS